MRNDFLDSILVVNFDKNCKSARKTTSGSIRSSSRAFERAYRGRAWIGSPVNMKVDSHKVSGIIGTGTLKPKELTLTKQSHEDPELFKVGASYTEDVILEVIRPFTALNSKMRKSQTVRNNVDKFQIEQVIILICLFSR